MGHSEVREAVARETRDTRRNPDAREARGARLREAGERDCHREMCEVGARACELEELHQPREVRDAVARQVCAPQLHELEEPRELVARKVGTLEVFELEEVHQPCEVHEVVAREVHTPQLYEVEKHQPREVSEREVRALEPSKLQRPREVHEVVAREVRMPEVLEVEALHHPGEVHELFMGNACTPRVREPELRHRRELVAREPSKLHDTREVHEVLAREMRELVAHEVYEVVVDLAGSRSCGIPGPCHGRSAAGRMPPARYGPRQRSGRRALGGAISPEIGAASQVRRKRAVAEVVAPPAAVRRRGLPSRAATPTRAAARDLLDVFSWPLSRLSALLERLPREKRRIVIEQRLSQRQRLLLQDWVLAQRASHLCAARAHASARESAMAKGRQGQRDAGEMTGITCHQRGGISYFNAEMSFGGLRFLTKTDKSLATVTRFRDMLLSLRGRHEAGQGDFEGRVREALSAACLDFGLSPEAMGLRVTVSLRVLWSSRALRTPPFRVASQLDQGLAAWRRLYRARGDVSHAKCVLHDRTPAQLESQWSRLRDEYIAVMSECGGLAQALRRFPGSGARRTIPKRFVIR